MIDSLFGWIGDKTASIFAPLINITTNFITGGLIGGGIGLIANSFGSKIPFLKKHFGGETSDGFSSGFWKGALAGGAYSAYQGVTALGDEKTPVTDKALSALSTAAFAALAVKMFGKEFKETITGGNHASLDDVKTQNTPTKIAANDATNSK